MISEHLKSWFKLKEQLYQEVVENELLSYTCQFFLNNKNNEYPRPNGTGVFIQYQNSKYLLSAAHVLEAHYNTTYIILGTDSLILGGELFLSELPKDTKNREHDFFDIAVLKLSQNTIIELESHNVQFLNADQLDVTHKPNSINNYLAVGFPAIKTDLRFTEAAGLMVKETEAVVKEKIYQKYSINTSDNIVTRYQRKNVFTLDNLTKHRGVFPYGISGCGLWSIQSMIRTGKGLIPVKLAGIMTKWIREDAIMITTHISKVLSFIDSLKVYESEIIIMTCIHGE